MSIVPHCCQLGAWCHGVRVKLLETGAVAANQPPATVCPSGHHSWQSHTPSSPPTTCCAHFHTAPPQAAFHIHGFITTAFNISHRIRTYIIEKSRNFMDHILAKIFVSSQKHYRRWGILKSNVWSQGTDSSAFYWKSSALSESRITGWTTGFISLDLFIWEWQYSQAKSTWEKYISICLCKSWI